MILAAPLANLDALCTLETERRSEWDPELTLIALTLYWQFAWIIQYSSGLTPTTVPGGSRRPSESVMQSR
jgi:hypothetical protein